MIALRIRHAKEHAPMAITRLLTAEDLEELGSDAKRFELYDGVLWEKGAMGQQHGEIEIEISSALHVHVRANRLGRVYPSDTHFILYRNPDKVVMPDVSIVRADRVPPESERIGFAPLAPDFVVEVVSPSDRIVEVIEKVRLYERDGIPLIWLVQPRTRSVTVYTSGTEPRTHHEGDVLDGDVIPGFQLAVADIFR